MTSSLYVEASGLIRDTCLFHQLCLSMEHHEWASINASFPSEMFTTGAYNTRDPNPGSRGCEPSILTLSYLSHYPKQISDI